MTKQRIENLQKYLLKHNIELFIVDNPIDLYYLTGLHLSTGRLLISQNNSCLFVDLRYLERVKIHSSIQSALLSEQNILDFVSKDILTLTFDAEATSYASYLSLKQQFSTKNLQPSEISPVKALRSIKDSEEKTKLRNAGLLCSKGYDFVLTLLKEGISEKQVATSLEIFWKEQGADALSFEPIIAFGKNSSMPHYKASTTTLKKGDIVLIDIGVTLECYASDMTRTIFFGTPDPLLQKAYFVVLEAQQEALSLCKKGALISSLNAKATEVITNHGFKDSIRHGIGHGIGLEVHELPFLKDASNTRCLEEDMAITIEPGIYLDGIGGIRIENSVLIKEDSYEDLTKRDTDIFVMK
ncbi:MAG: Xaa-Pro peptidase family protein [Chlamydiales bacterium]|nr:Xaa-Pro peptidase family protein [Chlamydiales bacterium]